MGGFDIAVIQRIGMDEAMDSIRAMTEGESTTGSATKQSEDERRERDRKSEAQAGGERGRHGLSSCTSFET